tara:strand:+ start:12151 stop:12414 length:264 start_codon:yes stop_codon:yes gene_type:complete
MPDSEVDERKACAKLRRARKQQRHTNQHDFGLGSDLVDCSACNGFSCDLERCTGLLWFALANYGSLFSPTRQFPGERKYLWSELVFT